MGEGYKRQSRRAVRIGGRDLAKRSTPAAADGKKGTSITAKDAAAALISRTATLDDPLTTSLLAEVTRRSMTVDVSPDQVDEAKDTEPGDPPDDPA